MEQIKLAIGEDGVAKAYDDTYDVTIHCENEQEQAKVFALIQAANRCKWIPVTERLPEEHDSFMNKFYGTDKFKPGMFRRLSNKVIVTERFPNGETQVTDGCTHDGKWWFHTSCIKREVIAWMPLPEPYGE